MEEGPLEEEACAMLEVFQTKKFSAAKMEMIDQAKWQGPLLFPGQGRRHSCRSHTQ